MTTVSPPKKYRKKFDVSSILKHWDERRHMRKETKDEEAIRKKKQKFLGDFK